MALIRVETIVGRTRLFLLFSGKGSARVSPGFCGKRAVHAGASRYRLQEIFEYNDFIISNTIRNIYNYLFFFNFFLKKYPCIISECEIR